MKHFKKILATVLIAGGVVSVAGCSSGTSYSSTSTAANWNVATSTTVEKNFIDYWRTHKEVANYSISFKAGSNSSYKVEYNTEEAIYTTSFYMDANDYDWGADNLPSGVKIDSSKSAAPQDPVYVYETTLSLKGRYVYKSTGESVDFEDSVVTKCKYRLAGAGLRPVYSEQIVKSTSPSNLTATSKDNMCVKVDAVYKTYYNRACNKAIVETDDLTAANKDSKKTVTVGGVTFDNSQLAFALRAFTLTGTKTFNVFSPQNASTQGITATCTTAKQLSTTSHSQIIEALKDVKDENGNPVDDYIFFDGSTPSDPEKPERQIRYHNIGLALKADMKGATPVYSYASVENRGMNATRAILLMMSTPISFGLGTLSYTLDSLSLQNITL